MSVQRAESPPYVCPLLYISLAIRGGLDAMTVTQINALHHEGQCIDRNVMGRNEGEWREGWCVMAVKEGRMVCVGCEGGKNGVCWL